MRHLFRRLGSLVGSGLSRRPRVYQPCLESLEDRVVPSSIVWTNRGAPANDSDGFNAIFGSCAEPARAVVRAALDAWQRSIVNFNQPLGGNTINVEVYMNGSVTGFGGSAQLRSARLGWPTGGTISISNGDGSGISSSGNVCQGWFIDPTPDDSAEFAGNIINPFTGRSSTSDSSNPDLFTVVTAEMFHLLGLMGGPTLLARNQNGFLTNTGVADTVDSGILWTFTGPSVSTLMTTDNGGSDSGFPLHFARPQGQAVAGQWGVIDPGNATYIPIDRFLPSNLDVLFLHDVYLYEVVQPEQFGTFHALRTLDAAGNPQLLIRGKPDLGSGLTEETDSPDVITLSADEANGTITVSVDLGSDDPGNGPTDAFVSTFDIGSFSSILINSFGGDDTITLEGFNDFTSVSSITINAGGGTDTLHVNDQGFRGSPYTIGATSLTRPAVNGTGQVNYDFTLENIIANTDSSTIEVTGVAVTTHLTVNAGNLGSSINVGPLSAVRGSLVVRGGTASDTLNINDQANSSSSTYLVTDTNASDATANVNYSAIERVVVNAGSANDVIDVWRTGAGTPVTVNGGGGDDTITVGNRSNELTDIRAAVTVNGNAHAMLGDTLVFNDMWSATNNTYTITATNLRRNGASIVSWATMEGLELRAGNGVDAVTVTGTRSGAPLLVRAGEGNDTVYLGDSANRLDGLLSQVTVRGEANTSTGDRLVVRDQGKASSQNYAVTSTAITRNPPSGTPVVRIVYETVERLEINGGLEGDTFDISSTAAATPLTVYAGNGNDAVNIGNPRTGLDAIAGTVTVHGQADTATGDDRLTLMDPNPNRLGKNYTVTLSRVGWSGGTQVTYGTMEQLVIQASAGNDEFQVPAGSPTSTITLNGNLGRDKLIGANVANTWNLTGMDQGNIGGRIVFYDVQDLVGGTNSDRFVFTANGAGVSGTIGGGAGTDALDYAAFTTRVDVDLSRRLATGVADGISAVDALDIIENVTGGSNGDYLIAGAASRIFRGGGGNDVMDGRLSQNIIFIGGEGDDTLIGGNGRDLLIGGLSGPLGDFLQGGLDDDLLIGGMTVYDNDDARLSAILAEWTSANSYATRLANLRAGVNGVELKAGITVLDDAGGADRLQGGGGADWFWIFARDLITDWSSTEETN